MVISCTSNNSLPKFAKSKPTNEHIEPCVLRTKLVYNSVTNGCDSIEVMECPQPTNHSVTGGSLISNQTNNYFKLAISSDSSNYNATDSCYNVGAITGLVAEYTINLPCIYCDSKYKIGHFEDTNQPQKQLGSITANIYTYLFKNGIEEDRNYAINILNTTPNTNLEYSEANGNKITLSDYYYYCSSPEAPAPEDDPHCNGKICKASVRINIDTIIIEGPINTNGSLNFPKYEFAFLLVDEDHDISFETDIRNLQANNNCGVTDSIFSIQNLKLLDKETCGHISDHIVITSIPICGSIENPIPNDPIEVQN